MEVKLSPNLFLSVEELNRLKSSLGENGWKRFAKSLVSQFGIAMIPGNTNFSPINSSGGNSQVLTISPGIAFDADMNAIILTQSRNIELPANQLSGDNKYWIIVRYKSTHSEIGTVSITSNGALTGSGTEFTKVLRGQPDFPTKVKFDNSINTGEYEVVSVDSDTSATLAGSFTAESNKKYSVVGTFTPGFIPSEENRQIYIYDDCEIEAIIDTDIPTLVESNSGYDFVLAAVTYTQASQGAYNMRIEDYRSRYILNKVFESTDNEVAKLAKNSLISLVRTDVVSVNDRGVLLELTMQHGFKVNSFSLTTLTTGYNVTIYGESNFADDSHIPNGVFNGWWILNKNNMQYCVVDSSVGNVLTVTYLNPEAVTDSGDLVIVPPFSVIEYRVKLDNNTPVKSDPYYFRCSIENINNKITIPVYWKAINDNFIDVVRVMISYRSIGYEKNFKYPFYPLNKASYVDDEGVSKFLEDGSSIQFGVEKWHPVVEKRNYS